MSIRRPGREGSAAVTAAVSALDSASLVSLRAFGSRIIALEPAGLWASASRPRWIDYFPGLIAVTLITALGLQMERGVAPVNVAMLCLLAVVVVSLRGGPGPALLDFALISQALVNLIDNALKHSPAQQPVELQAREGSGMLEIAVLDQGPGFSEPDLDQVFERFHRGRNAAPTSGTGLGLSLCRGFVEAHGGKIWAERRPPSGAILKFTIPLAAEPDQPPD